MSQPAFTMAVLALLAVHIVSRHRLLRRLASLHPATHEAVSKGGWGRPRRENWAFARFIFAIEWRGLGDSVVSGWSMITLVSLVAGFVGAIVSWFL